MFDDLNKLVNIPAEQMPSIINPELCLNTTLGAHLGGLQPVVPEDILLRETENDQQLREQILAGNVPTVDTIIRCVVEQC
jgi:hypothetical protein